MIPQNFEYSSPANLQEALGLIADGNAKVLAGGMSLIPLMKLRLAAPGHLVDISRIPGLNYVREEGAPFTWAP
jgi:CO/xanthine dehydrogenase FAD-binding subunit